MPSLPRDPTPRQLQAAYSEGLSGWLWDLEAERNWEGFWNGAPGFPEALRDSHRSVERAHCWRSREKYDPGALGQEKQIVGDCVSHGSRTARDVSRTLEFHINGEPEEYYKRSATEPTYGSRPHSGSGMQPSQAAVFERDYGWLFRENYEGVVDLTNYNGNLGEKWGGRLPSDVRELCRDQGYNVGTVTRPRSVEEVKDLLANGYAAHSGQSWGTGTSTGPDGLNRSNGSGWNHDMAIVGYDSSRSHWQETVYFVPNSWGPWNQRNPKWDDEAHGPWVPGMIVIPEDEFEKVFVRQGSIHHYSEIAGFQVRELPSWGFDYV